MSRIKETDLSLIINDLSYVEYLDRFKMLATSLFTWENLDNICGFGASRFLEKALFEDGRACFVNDKNIGFKVFRANPHGKFNIYGLPIDVTAYSYEYNKDYKLDDIVLIMNNELQKPTAQFLQLFAYRLYNTERTIDTNLNAQKTPILLEGSNKEMLTLKNLYMQYDGNIPFIFGNKTFDIGGKINAINTLAPYLIDKLDIHKSRIFNEALTLLGIDNANTDKKERMITNEVESNDQLINYYLNCWYKTRKQACDMINDKFLINREEKIKVVLNKNIYELLSDTNLKFSEDMDYGEIYDNN